MKLSCLIITAVFIILTACNNFSKKENLSIQPHSRIEKISIELINGKRLSTDSFRLVAPAQHGSSITRILDQGFYKFLVFNEKNGFPVSYSIDSIAVLDFLNDSLYDINGDRFKDLVINCQTRNGQCQPAYATVFCFDTASNSFANIHEIAEFPNPRFYPETKSISGESECMMKKSSYQLRWKGISLDTIYIMGENLKPDQ